MIMLALIGVGVWWLLHPVCVPLSDVDLREFARWAPIEIRSEETGRA